MKLRLISKEREIPEQEHFGEEGDGFNAADTTVAIQIGTTEIIIEQIHIAAQQQQHTIQVLGIELNQQIPSFHRHKFCV